MAAPDPHGELAAAVKGWTSALDAASDLIRNDINGLLLTRE